MKEEEEERWVKREEVWRAKVQEVAALLEAAEAKQKSKQTSVADPWHFGVDPDPDLDPRILVSKFGFVSVCGSC